MVWHKMIQHFFVYKVINFNKHGFLEHRHAISSTNLGLMLASVPLDDSFAQMPTYVHVQCLENVSDSHETTASDAWLTAQQHVKS